MRPIGTLRGRLFFLTLAVGWILVRQDAAAQAPDPHIHAPPRQIQSQAPTATNLEADPAVEAVLSEKFVEPLVSRYAENFKTGTNLASPRNALRVMFDDIRHAMALKLQKQIAVRKPTTDAIREHLVERLTELASTPQVAERLRALVDDAAEEEMLKHRDHLYSALVCWCPKEKWTRSLAGCPDGCAEQQKGMVVAGLGEGLTNEEIIERMVAQGGEQVRGYARKRSAYLVPFLVLCVAVIIVGFALSRVRKDKTTAPTATKNIDGGLDGGAPALSEEDARWEGLIEKELKEMDD